MFGGFGSGGLVIFVMVCYDVVIVGGGYNGLIVVVYLVFVGKCVIVFEWFD